MAHKNWIKEGTLLTQIEALVPVVRLNPEFRKMTEVGTLPLGMKDIEIARDLFRRFAPFFKKAFPKIVLIDELIQSPLQEINRFKNISDHKPIEGRFFLKCDHDLPIAGSIKARGGFYEVLHFAEKIALENKLIQPGDSYEVFAGSRFKDFFSRYTIGVGSTGNLGLSIGIMSAQLGFKVNVYMSADAKEWKKKLLRSKGVNVVEFSGDFGEAITAGRANTLNTPYSYFVDDERSMHLYLGYSTAAFEVQKQLAEQSITVDKDHPLFVYLPCGVGGAPGGITFGLKQLYGDHVHCFFGEPTHSPAVLVGLLTGLMEKISVHDLGIDNITEADGLAVARPSAFASPISKLLVSGNYTFEDDSLYRQLYLLKKTENIQIEPSAAAGLLGPDSIGQSGYIEFNHFYPKKITHLAWSTGGLLMPQDDYESFYSKGEKLYQNKFAATD